MKSTYIIIILLLLTSNIKAQDYYPAVKLVENRIDSGLLKKYHKIIDSHRIKVEFNKVRGIASFYSANLNGTLTSTGERYKNKKYTAASNLFLLNTIVRVTSLKNGKSVLVRINDRMHPSMLRKGRVIDLSGAAAKNLAMSNHLDGLVKVIIEAVDHSRINPINN
jgi:rare lipoprotein A (peptidoglycan hydrolase)